MGLPKAWLVVALAAARPVTDVARCKHFVRKHLEAAGNVADDEWATLVCASEYLPEPAARKAPTGPPVEAFEGIMCPRVRHGTRHVEAVTLDDRLLDDLTLGKFFFYAATHPAYAAARRFNYTGWQFLPKECGEQGWFRAACSGSVPEAPRGWRPALLWWTAAAVRTRLSLVGPCAQRRRDALLATRSVVGSSRGSPSKTCIAVHIRRGDACQAFGGARVAGQRRCFPTAAYVAAARRLARRYGTSTVRVASDSPRAVDEFAALAGADLAVEALRFDRGRVGGPENATLGLGFAAAQERFIERRPDAPDAALAAASFLADLELLGSCQAFVGTWEATLSRLAVLNLAARVRTLPPFVFLDAPNDRRVWGPRRGRLALPEEHHRTSALAHASAKEGPPIRWLNATTASAFLARARGASCAVVGSGAALRGRGRGSIIDAHDVVVRINRVMHAGGLAGDLGARTDVYFTKLCRAQVRDWRAPLVLELQADDGVEGRRCSLAGEQRCPFSAFVFMAHGKGRTCRRRRWLDTSLARAAATAQIVLGEQDPAAYDAAAKILGALPTMGFHAIYTLRPICGSLTLFGFAGNVTLDGHPITTDHDLAREHALLWAMARDPAPPGSGVVAFGNDP